MRFANPRGHGLKVLVCGSRNWLDREAINARVAALPPGSIVIQGGARGADLMARRAAALANLHCAEVPAMWRNGKGAGHARNRAMLDLGPDLVIAFQLGGSSGTQGTIDEARKRGIPVEVHTDGCRGTNGCDCAKCAWLRGRTAARLVRRVILPDADEALLMFRGQYGRYCALAAERLNAGSHKHALLTNPKVARAKRQAVQSAQMLKLVPGVTRADILEAARQAKHAVEAEWNVVIPIVAEVQD